MDTKEIAKKQREIDVAYAKKQIEDIDSGRLNHFDKSFVLGLRRQMICGIENPNLIAGVCQDPDIICSMCKHGIQLSKKCYIGGWIKCDGIKFESIA